MKILVTGGQGFIGQHIVKRLSKDKNNQIIVPKRHEVDLTSTIATFALFEEHRPDRVVHCAGHNGGVAYNSEKPADIFYANTMMALNVFKNAARINVKKVVSFVTSCAYPESDEPLIEEQFLSGEPHQSVKSHGYAKRNVYIAAQLFAEQFRLHSLIFCPNTVYGPGDRYDHRSKVVMALVKKFVEAKENDLPEVICWGTGEARREFIYIDDLVDIVEEGIFNEENGLVNVTSGQEWSILSLAEEIADCASYRGKIVWDTSKPEGCSRKSLSPGTRERDYTTMHEGLQRPFGGINEGDIMIPADYHKYPHSIETWKHDGVSFQVLAIKEKRYKLPSGETFTFYPPHMWGTPHPECENIEPFDGTIRERIIALAKTVNVTRDQIDFVDEEIYEIRIPFDAETWVNLINMEGDLLPQCCSPISTIRDAFISALRHDSWFTNENLCSIIENAEYHDHNFEVDHPISKIKRIYDMLKPYLR